MGLQLLGSSKKTRGASRKAPPSCREVAPPFVEVSEDSATVACWQLLRRGKMELFSSEIPCEKKSKWKVLDKKKWFCKKIGEGSRTNKRELFVFPQLDGLFLNSMGCFIVVSLAFHWRPMAVNSWSTWPHGLQTQRKTQRSHLTWHTY